MTKKKVEPDAPTPPQRPRGIVDVVKEFVMPKEKLWTCKICGLDKQTGETCPVDGGARS